MVKENKNGMTVKDTAMIAATAYVVVKATQGLSRVAVDTAQFFRARKDNKTEEK